ncbi:MAG: ArsR family transcriptional regulator [Candidatus Baldrarchaeia archaeon]
MLEGVDYIDPLARLSKIRNMKRGLIVRTLILRCLREAEGSGRTIKEINDETNLSYGVILHHLKKLEQERIVSRKGKKPYKWLLTGLGQRLIDKYLKIKFSVTL